MSTALDRPHYLPGYLSPINAAALLSSLIELPWRHDTDARSEYFMAEDPTAYTYGSGRGVRTYTSAPYTDQVRDLQAFLNGEEHRYNVCFLNRYDDARQALGWHADDSPGMRHDHPIAVVSLGAAREIWWRPVAQTGVVPIDQRQLLEHGSLFVMPPGFQRTHQHRIPKAPSVVGTRVSLTFRRYVPEVPL